MLIYADKLALITAGILTVICLIFYFLYTKKENRVDVALQDEIGVIEEPDAIQKEKIDKQYLAWKWATIIVTIIALGMYLVPLIVIR